jgi:hypothetical protein
MDVSHGGRAVAMCSTTLTFIHHYCTCNCLFCRAKHEMFGGLDMRFDSVWYVRECGCMMQRTVLCTSQQLKN